MKADSDETSSLLRQEIGFHSPGVTLAGTLHVPASVRPHPAVVMLQGSGTADRDCAGYFPPIRHAFLQRGTAVYSFDKPGISGSSGDWRHFAFFDRTDQAQAAIAALKEHAAIDPRRVGLWGQSQGGWIVQLVASRTSDLAFASPVRMDYGVERATPAARHHCRVSTTVPRSRFTAVAHARVVPGVNASPRAGTVTSYADSSPVQMPARWRVPLTPPCISVRVKKTNSPAVQPMITVPLAMWPWPMSAAVAPMVLDWIPPPQRWPAAGWWRS